MVYGDKLYKPYRPLFPTPTDIPLETTCVTMSLPENPAFLGLWIGALLILCDEENFVQFDGGISRETTAEIFREALLDALLLTEISCELAPPYWDDPEGDDATTGEDNPEFPFYEDAAAFVIAGFVLYAAGIGAALQFWTVQKQFRIALRKSDIGGIISIFMDGDLVTEVDTYTAGAPDLVYVTVPNPSTVLRLEVTGKNAAVIGDPVTQIIRKRLSAEELLPPNTRWSEDCDCVQVTWDGETWVDSPPNDPRYGPGFRAPARTGIDAKCLAAANMVALIEQQVDAAIAAGTAVQLVTSLLAIIAAFIIGFNIVIAILWAVAEALLTYGQAALVADFTEETYETLICIFYNHIDNDGQVSDAQLEDILADIEAEWGISLIYPVVEALISANGSNGFSNAGALGDAEGDCSECPQDWTYRWDFHENDGGFVFDSEAGNSGGTWIGGVGHGYQKAYTGIVCAQWDCSRKSANFTIGSATHVTSMSISLDAQGSDQCSHIEAYIGANRSAGLSEPMHIYAGTNGTSVTATGDITNVGTVHFTFATGNSDGTGDFYSITITGTGIPPADLSGGEFI